MDINSLLHAIDVLAQPTKHSAELIFTSQKICDSFKATQTTNLHQFFQLFCLDQLKGKIQY